MIGIEMLAADNDAKARAAGKVKEYKHVGPTAKEFLAIKFRVYRNHWCEIWKMRLTRSECRILRDKHALNKQKLDKDSEWHGMIEKMHSCNRCWRDNKRWQKNSNDS